MKETDFKNIAYSALLPELEKLEHEGKYKGNGHHLAQRLCDKLWEKFEIHLKEDPT